MAKGGFYKNLDAEQSRKGLTNKQVAEFIGVSPGRFAGKKKSGHFYAREALALCKLFECDFVYLFAEEGENMLARQQMEEERQVVG